MRTIMVYFDRKRNAFYRAKDEEREVKITADEAHDLAHRLYARSFAEPVKFTPFLVKDCAGWQAEVEK